MSYTKYAREHEPKYDYRQIKKLLKQKCLDEKFIEFFLDGVVYTLPQIKRILEAHND